MGIKKWRVGGAVRRYPPGTTLNVYRANLSCAFDLLSDLHDWLGVRLLGGGGSPAETGKKNREKKNTLIIRYIFLLPRTDDKRH